MRAALAFNGLKIKVLIKDKTLNVIVFIVILKTFAKLTGGRLVFTLKEEW